VRQLATSGNHLTGTVPLGRVVDDRLRQAQHTCRPCTQTRTPVQGEGHSRCARC
jgi:hypothetical protein